MARKRGAEAESAERQERWDRWRVLIRNPEFQKDVREVRCFLREKGSGELPVNLMQKWGIYWRIIDVLWRPDCPDLSYITLKDYETFFSERPIRDSVALVPYDSLRYPLLSLDTVPEHQVLVAVDLTYPFSITLENITKLLKAEMQRRPRPKRSGGFGYLPASRSRRRHDKLGFQLEVLDQYMNGEPTWKIAKNLSIRPPFKQVPVATVKSALRIAMKLTGIERARHGRAWFNHHIANCPDCGRRKKLNFDCPAVRQRNQAIAELIEAKLKDFESSFIPRRPVEGEKSAFADWEAKHPRRYHKS